MATALLACPVEDSEGSGSSGGGGDVSASTTGSDDGGRRGPTPGSDLGRRSDAGGTDLITVDEGGTGVDTAPSECPYPDGPYAFSQNSVVGPMSWPSAVAGADETLSAALAEIRCDPTVNSVFVQISATFCTYCPDRNREIAGLKDFWETHGAKWIWVVIDVSDAQAAANYMANYGATFGWSTHDGDNSYVADGIKNSGAFAAQPWTGVIRTSDMVLVYDEPDDAYLDLQAIARELSGL